MDIQVVLHNCKAFEHTAYFQEAFVTWAQMQLYHFDRGNGDDDDDSDGGVGDTCLMLTSSLFTLSFSPFFDHYYVWKFTNIFTLMVTIFEYSLMHFQPI